VEAFIAAELERTVASSAATRYRSLQQLFKWLDDEGEISGSPMVRMPPPIIPEQPVPVLSDDRVRGLLAACSGKDSHATDLWLQLGKRADSRRAASTR
jgi:integrase